MNWRRFIVCFWMVIGLQLSARAPAQEWWRTKYESQPVDARIRYIAKGLVEDLEQPSCASLGVPPGFNRAKALESEKAAVEEFKGRIRGSAGYFHFLVGEADGRYEQQLQSGCWNDSETWIADLHVKQAKESTKARLDALEKLVSKLENPADWTKAGSPQVTAEFVFEFAS